MKPIVRIAWENFFPDFSDDLCRSRVLMELADDFDFVFEGNPDILLINCYSQRPIAETGAVKVGYYTENLPPDLVNYDYFFGCEYTHRIGHPRYCKRVYGPLSLYTFEGSADPEAALAEKSEFCNFIYSHRVRYRERFYRAMSQYRPVRSPGRSMNNSSDLVDRFASDWQAQKRAYLRRFKFTIAFENSRRVGYVTEKLLDAFAADSVPIYWGDPELETIVNKGSVVWVDGDWEREVLPWLCLPERRQPFQPHVRTPTLPNKLAGRANVLSARLRSRWPYHKGFAAALEEVRELDNDDAAYCRKLAQARAKRDVILRIRADYFVFWRKIIAEALRRQGDRRI